MEDAKIIEKLEEINKKLGKVEEIDKRLIRVETYQEISTKDIGELKTTVGSLKKADDQQEAINAYIKFNKQTFSRPLLVGIIIASLGLIMGLVSFFISFKTSENMNTAIKNIVQAQQGDSHE